MLIEDKYNVVLRSFDDNANKADLNQRMQKELKLNELQCEFIEKHIPVVLYQDLGEEEVELIKPRLDSLMQVGVNYEITMKSVDDLTKMLWQADEISEKISKLQPEQNINTESDTMDETTNEQIINCPCASCGTVLKITKTDSGIEIKSITNATKNPLQSKSDNNKKRKYTYEDLERIIKAVEENIYGGIESLQDLPTKPDFNIDFKEYGFKSVTDFMEYQNSLLSNKSLDSWTGGN